MAKCPLTYENTARCFAPAPPFRGLARTFRGPERGDL